MKENFRDFLKDKIVLLDGAIGTELIKRGMPSGTCPEQWVLDNPAVLINLQTEYIQAGSDVIFTSTFGGSRYKLEEYGLGDKTVEINKKLAEISRKVAGNRAFVAGDISSTGRFVEPFGDLGFEDAVENYKLQVKGLLEGGVDFFVIETMIDIQEARAALIAVKESCDLPVCVSMTFDENGRTLTGTDPVTALITLQSLGADAVGCNCSTGPETMVEVIRRMKPFSKIPLFAKPNAGLPKLVDGQTVFNMRPEEFASYAKDFIDSGVNMLGGCCGTTPLYISLLSKKIKGLSPVHYEIGNFSAVTSARKTVFVGLDKPLVVVGERINPTGKKKLQKGLREGNLTEIRKYAKSQIEQGAEILDINAGMPGIDEKQTVLNIVKYLSPKFDAPLCIDSSSPEVIEAALRIYPGRALINSISGEKSKFQELLPIARKYGAMFILLPLNENGVPETCDERYEVVKSVIKEAKNYGFCESDIIVDGLVMTVSSNQDAPLETLKLIKWVTDDIKCNTVIGLSNVSFGLPERAWVNSAFLAMAQGMGLTMAILNPSEEILMNVKKAGDVLTGKDKNSSAYIAHFSEQAAEKANESRAGTSKEPGDRIYNAIITGDTENIEQYIKDALNKGMNASVIVDSYMIPAITHTGDLYEKKEYYLPQLVQSAEAMKQGFSFVEPLLVQAEGDQKRSVKVVMATVKGDIHDIGKNIVALMLKNYGFEVIDLGKDVPSEEIVKKAQAEKADIIALSALMTTTMHEMESVVKLCRAQGIESKIIIGGAVVTEKYCREIEADGYASDAYGAVKLAKKLID